ncbi:hypothetical protein NDU88_004915 [Pleurodeles waltl]|uniref:Uncharacterized protein n=1 Tax=Pleurodeles waltl TaxID=8319 RepID=A0AAV7N4D9_PLEWA|nr:hypothetical protein NDU88_004915 [Pleurodeles waltl]
MVADKERHCGAPSSDSGREQLEQRGFPCGSGRGPPEMLRVLSGTLKILSGDRKVSVDFNRAGEPRTRWQVREPSVGRTDKTDGGRCLAAGTRNLDQQAPHPSPG